MAKLVRPEAANVIFWDVCHPCADKAGIRLEIRAVYLAAICDRCGAERFCAKTPTDPRPTTLQ